ncbi:MAG: pyruvate, phosphate dikinase, partial [Verrucomicrobia bacterium]|nr:pyruvate, phosphate dikinase [Verrucomicrobiota bacterium]
EAAAEVIKKKIKCKPEIMVPLVGFKKELDLQVSIINEVAAAVMKEKKIRIPYMVGTMIEVPRGALTADEIAQTAQFFSFGTNDLTQMTLGMSRDDSGKFLPAYQNAEIVTGNPFASIDQTGVGKLIRMAVAGGRQTRPDIKLGICGEHGGDPASVKFCNSLGLTYVSCSPYRVTTARLAAAQAALEQEECCCCCGKGDKCCKNEGKAKTAKTAKVASKAAKASAPVKAAKTAKKAAKKPAKKTAKK